MGKGRLPFLKDVEIQMSRLTTSITAGPGGSYDVGSLVAHIVADTSQLQTGLKVSTAQVAGFTSKVNTFLKTNSAHIKQVSREMSMYGAAVVGSLGLMVRSYIKFDEAMRIATAVTDTTTTQYQQMSDAAVEVSKRWGRAAADAAQAYYFLGSAGLTAVEQMAAFEPVALLATGATMQMGEAADMVVNTMRGFHISFDRSREVVDQLTNSVITSNQNAHQLGEAFSYVAGMSWKAGNSVAETAAALGFMADMGIKGSLAGTVLRRALGNLMAPTSAIREELERWGIVTYDATGQLKPFIVLVGELNDALRGASEEQQNHAYRIIFGMRAIAGMIGVLSRGKRALKAYADSIANAGGTAEKLAEKQLLAVNKQLDIFKQHMGDAARTASMTLGPAINGLIQSGIMWTEHIQVWIEAHEGLTAVILKTTATVGGLLIVVGVGARSLIWVLGGVVAVMGPVIGSFKSLTVAIMGATAAASAFALVLSVVVVAAFVAATVAALAYQAKVEKLILQAERIRKATMAFTTAADVFVDAKKKLDAFYATQPDMRKLDAREHLEYLQTEADLINGRIDSEKNLIEAYKERLKVLKRDMPEGVVGPSVTQLEKRIARHEADLQDLELHARMLQQSISNDEIELKRIATLKTQEREIALKEEKALRARRTSLLEHFRASQTMTRMERIVAIRKLASEMDKESTLYKQAMDSITAIERERVGQFNVYLAEMRDDFQDWNMYLNDKTGDLAVNIETSLSHGFSQVLLHADNFKEVLGNTFIQIGESFINMVGEMIARWVMFTALTRIGGFAMPGLGPLPGLAEGGIVTKPTIARLAENGQPEAVIPLNKMKGMGGVTINIVNPWDGASVIRAMKTQAVESVLADYKRNGPVRTIIRESARR